MDILFAANIDINAAILINNLSGFNNVAVIADRSPEYELESRSLYIKKDFYKEPEGEDFGLMLCYVNKNFTAEKLDSVFKTASENGIKNLTFIKQLDFFGNTADETDFVELLGDKYKRERGIITKEIITPPLYSDDKAPEFFVKIYNELRKTNYFLFHKKENSVCDVMKTEDLSDFIRFYIDNNLYGVEEGENRFFPGSGYTFTLKTLTDSLKGIFSDINILFDEKAETVNFPQNNEGWSGKQSFIDNLRNVITLAELESKDYKRSRHISGVVKLYRLLSFAALLAFTFFYSIVIPVSSDLQYVDLKIIFIIFAGLCFPYYYSIAAAFACCIITAVQIYMNNISWQIVFYHVDNWIPFFIYIITAMTIIIYRSGNREGK